jgi:TPR repeat protein
MHPKNDDLLARRDINGSDIRVVLEETREALAAQPGDPVLLAREEELAREMSQLLAEAKKRLGWGSQDPDLMHLVAELTEDPEEAFASYLFLEKITDPYGIYMLGCCYKEGRGCTASPTKARVLLARASRLGVELADHEQDPSSE